MKKFLAMFMTLTVLLGGISVSAAEAATEETEEPAQVTRLRYADALRRALDGNAMLVQMEEQLVDDRHETGLTNIRDNLRRYLELRRFAGNLTMEEEDQIMRQLADLNANINTIRQSQAIIRVSTEMQLRSALVNIANTEADIAVLEGTLVQERENVRAEGLRFASGLISETAFRDAEMQLEQREASLATMHVNLESEWNNLRRIVQMPIDTDFYVEYEIELVPLPENLNAFINQTVPNQPTVRQADIVVNRALALYRDLFNEGGTRERLERERAYNQARREHDTLFRAVETAARNQYNNITMLEQQYDSLQLDLERALERREIAELNYAAGLISRLAVEAADLGILAAESAIERNITTRWLAQFSLQHPFLLAMQ